MPNFDNTVTPDEAVERCCPMVATWAGCAVAGCMAWRWAPDIPRRQFAGCDDPSADDEPPRPSTVPADWLWVPSSDEADGIACWIEPDDEWRARWRGYCGLAPLPVTD